MSSDNSEEITSTCTRCGTNTVSHYICQFTNGEKETLELCDECATDWNKKEPIPFPDIRDKTCYYCNAQPVSGSMNQPWEKKVRQEDFHFSCSTCFQNYGRILLEWIATIPKDISPEEQIERMGKAIEKIDEEVRLISRKPAQ